MLDMSTYVKFIENSVVGIGAKTRVVTKKQYVKVMSSLIVDIFGIGEINGILQQYHEFEDKKSLEEIYPIIDLISGDKYNDILTELEELLSK